MKEYVLKTRSGSFYEILDESHLWFSDTWIVIVNGERCVVMSVADVASRQTLIDVAKGRVPAPTIRNLEDGVGSHIERGTCKGHAIVYVKETLIRPYLKTRKVPAATWQEISNEVGNTSPIVAVYKKVY